MPTHDDHLPERRRDYSDDVQIVLHDGREFILVGTAHVSRESAKLVRQVITEEKPDHVAVELDAQRYEALANKARWDSLDLRQIFREKQVATLLANLLLASYQKKLGDKLGVMPGTELLEAVKVAEEQGVPYRLADRNIRITMLRAWRSMTFFQRIKLMSEMTAGLFFTEEITEEQLRELRSGDVISELMDELAAGLPQLKRVLIDERDAYLAEEIRNAPGRRIVAVIGAGHVAGIKRAIVEDLPTDMQAITSVPPVSTTWKWVGWSIPAVILGSLGIIAATQGGAAMGQSALFWVLATAIPSGIGAALALSHPLTILSAMVAAPITSLSPLIGAGHVTALVQTWIRPPRVRDFHAVAEDAGSVRLWWSNRLLKVLLAFILPSLGAMIGIYVGGAEILRKLFDSGAGWRIHRAVAG